MESDKITFSSKAAEKVINNPNLLNQFINQKSYNSIIAFIECLQQSVESKSKSETPITEVSNLSNNN